MKKTFLVSLLLFGLYAQLMAQDSLSNIEIIELSKEAYVNERMKSIPAHLRKSLINIRIRAENNFDKSQMLADSTTGVVAFWNYWEPAEVCKVFILAKPDNNCFDEMLIAIENNKELFCNRKETKPKVLFLLPLKIEKCD